MRIIAQIKPQSGSDYHRKLIPLQYLKADFVEELTTEIVRNYDILWINRNCNISAASLSIWKESLGIKIVFDLDDSFKIPGNYPGVNNHIKSNPLVKDKIFLSDYVIVSTQELVKEVKPLNSNVVVIPNRLDYKNILIKKETLKEFQSRKIRVGIIGAYTHHQDWKSIKHLMNTLVKNEEFKEKCEFVILGYNKSAHEYWKEFIHLGKVVQAMMPDKYLRLFHEIDIILCPLLDNDFNKAKSSLRILESGVGDCICILDKLYQEKSDIPNPSTCGFVVQQDKQWLTYVLDLIKEKDTLFEVKKRFGKEIRKLEFQPVVDARKEVCEKVLMLNKEPMRHHLYSIKYKDEQLVEYFPYVNKVNSVDQKSYLFEYQPIIEIVDKLDGYKDWIGVFSWKFPIKTKLFKKKVQKILDENSQYDCINFSKEIKSYLSFTEKQHPGFMELFKFICKDLGLPVSEPKNTIYSNFFVLNKGLYQEYVNEVIKPAIDLLETKYKDLAWRDANYRGGLPKDLLKQYTGLDYYTFHTFILERLIGQWVDKKKLKILNYK